ncbi:hypothetical protein HK097_009149 [Rhizophlyctis rosea]|uniref:NACHT domain-containing protein n=1 Tax=Rhizophlyctis rosea TaxID=64517 RepID=A0AAD5X1A0_9FUNG|nr:hypothetical protein HK097_009149 [Rhizophlyctis rosea]
MNTKYGNMALSKSLPRIIHSFGQPGSSLGPWLEFVMTAARRGAMRIWIRYFENMAEGNAAGLNKKLHLLVGQPGVGKTTLLAAITQALLCRFPSTTLLPCYFSYREDAQRNILPSELIHLTLCRAGLLNPLETFLQPEELHEVLSYIQSKQISIVLVLDEVQEVAKWSQEEAVLKFSEQLGLLQRTAAAIMTICSGSSVYCAKLLTGKLTAEGVQFGGFISYHAWKSLEHEKIYSLPYLPISSQGEFAEVVQNMVNPEYVDYDSALWSLEQMVVGDPMDVDEEDSDTEASDRPLSYAVSDQILSALFSASGGKLRGLSIIIGGMRDPVGRQLKAPRDTDVQQLRANQIESLRSMNAAHPYASAILDHLFNGTCALLSSEKLSNVDLFDLPMLDAALLKGASQAQLITLADAGHLKIDFDGFGAVSRVGFPSANTLVALLNEHKLLNSNLTVEHLWMARLVLKTLGIEMEEILNQALVDKPLARGGISLSPGSYNGISLATDVIIWLVVQDPATYHSQIDRHNSHHRTKGRADKTRLATWSMLGNQIFRTYPHNLEAGGADAILFTNASCELIQYKLGGSVIEDDEATKIVKRLKDALSATKRLISAGAMPISPSNVRLHICTTRPISDAARATFKVELVEIWDREDTSEIWPEPIKEMSRRLQLAPYIGGVL